MMSVKALFALVPASLLFSGSLVLFIREKTASTVLQLLGSACLVVGVLSHVCEAFRFFPSMHFGHEHSAGHYLDFWAVVLGFSLFPVGYLVYSLTKHRL